jgi:NAD(P)-dependent dehydrogenase (short-subunit alcohol dehydrogenase family)
MMATVLITGCSSGFGLLAALQFARKGDRVFASMRDLARSADLDRAAEAEGLSIEKVRLDVTDEASVREAVQQVVAAAGRIDVLVNNAGIGHHGPLEETDDDEAREIFDTNFFGAMNVVRQVAPLMRRQGSGTIVNVSSLAGRVPPPFGGVYSASKFALEAASEALYFELHPFGVRVLLIEPGGFQTRIEESRRVSRRFTEGSPYLDFERRFEEALTRLPAAGVRADPQIVAELIYEAVYDKEPKLRYLVGQDAEMIGGLKKQLDDAQFEQTMRQALDFWE